MSLRFDESPRLGAIGQRVTEGLWHIGEPMPPVKTLRLIGPIPVYVLNETAQIGKRAAVWKKANLWRGLVLADGAPVATIQFRVPPKNLSLEVRGLDIGVRGLDSAKALFAAFLCAERFAAGANGEFQVKFIILPRLFITAIWLDGPRSVFIPTRTGSAIRPQPECYSKSNFLKFVRRIRKRMRRHVKLFPHLAVPAKDKRTNTIVN